MLTDVGCLLDTAFAPGGSATSYSTYAYDSHAASIGGATRDISGHDCPLWLNICVTTSFATSTSTEFVIISSASTTLSSSPTVHTSTGAIVTATLVAGYSVSIPLTPGAYKRYVGIKYLTVGTTDATGKVTATITDGVPLYTAYANNWTN